MGFPRFGHTPVQSTFINLARHADRLTPDTILTAWLYQVTRRKKAEYVLNERAMRAEPAPKPL